MKKIGIITILNVNNYGAELQAFALQEKLNKLGYDAQIIDYLFYKNPKFKRTSRSKPFIKLSFKQWLKESLYPYYKKIKTLPYLKMKKVRDKKFEEFHIGYTNRSIQINTINKLYVSNFDYDIYIVGSDQVWNPYTNVNIEPYFLNFAPKTAKKISYASSFGVSEIPIQNQGRYKELLNNIDFIGVREKQGKKIVENLTDKKATWVLDPTFLLKKDEWLDYSSQSTIDEPYLLMYILTDADYITNLARKISKELGLKIVRICKNSFVEDKSDDVINIIDAGPKEYLGLFSKASFVLTTSFHGTCFSVNFSIPFFTILKENKDNNSRQINLLEELNLKERILYVDDKFPEVKTLREIQFDQVEKKLNRQIELSIDFLQKSIKS